MDLKTEFNKICVSIENLAEIARKSTIIDSLYYEKMDVKRGLRDVNGKGVVAGLTEISEIISKKEENGVIIPLDGRLYYRGILIEKIVDGFVKEERFGFEETAYLLIFGKLPTIAELTEFNEILGVFRRLPLNFVRDVTMKKPSVDMMNVLQRSVLTLYAYDECNPDDVSVPNVLRQCLQLLSQMPLLSVYGYQVYKHYYDEESLIIHKPDPTLGTAENTLRLLRPSGEFSHLEAKILDLCYVLHAEHGGGNNSTFTTHVVSSSGTDTYSAVAASLGSLKGPKHGGANVKVVKMIEDIKTNLTNYSDSSIRNYLMQILNKEVFDKQGLIYGMGHAVYSISDPRATIFRSFVKELAIAKDFGDDFELYQKIERLAPEVIADKRKIYKGVNANVDFYSGFVYNMLGLPTELFTPAFAIARMAGWTAHRIEEISNNGKIIRPAYEAVAEHKEYVNLSERKI
ncbi:MAG: citrate/2-methylcitrate synthase [Christensenellaceae bacterium]|nr:citrate/2-methylcitrate synthase [Christensenellaceae bacterium]